MGTFTQTETYTKTDIRRVYENFAADLKMLTVRTQARIPNDASEYAHDICLMTQEDCLAEVHIQLRDCQGNLVKVHQYSVKKDMLADSQRPGENRWPRLPDGTLEVLVKLSDGEKFGELKESEKFKIPWENSSVSTDYTGMNSDGARLYSSGSYGLQRTTFSN